MKAVANLILMVALILIFIMVLLAINLPFNDENIKSRIEKTIHIEPMSTTIELAKEYVKVSFDYATYQACYDILQRGGWYSGGETVMFEDEEYYKLNDDQSSLISELQDEIEHNVNVYTEGERYAYSTYSTELPIYAVIIDDIGSDYIQLSGNGDKEFSIKTIEQGDELYQEMDSSINKKVKINILSFFEKIKSQNDFLKQLGLEDILKTELEKLDFISSIEKPLSSLENKDGGTEAICEEIIQNELQTDAVNDWKEDTIVALIVAEDEFSEEIFDTEKEDENYIMIYKVVGIDIEHSLISGMKSSGTATCSYGYKVKANILLNITDNSDYYPVFNGEIVNFEPLQFIGIITIEYPE